MKISKCLACSFVFCLFIVSNNSIAQTEYLIELGELGQTTISEWQFSADTPISEGGTRQGYRTPEFKDLEVIKQYDAVSNGIIAALSTSTSFETITLMLGDLSIELRRAYISKYTVAGESGEGAPLEQIFFGYGAICFIASKDDSVCYSKLSGEILDY